MRPRVYLNPDFSVCFSSKTTTTRNTGDKQCTGKFSLIMVNNKKQHHTQHCVKNAWCDDVKCWTTCTESIPTDISGSGQKLKSSPPTRPTSSKVTIDFSHSGNKNWKLKALQWYLLLGFSIMHSPGQYPPPPLHWLPGKLLGQWGIERRKQALVSSTCDERGRTKSIWKWGQKWRIKIAPRETEI